MLGGGYDRQHAFSCDFAGVLEDLPTVLVDDDDDDSVHINLVQAL